MMQLNPGAFNRFLDGIGQDFNWRKSYSCPCMMPHSGAPDMKCGLCHGRGRIWDPAIKGRSGIAGQKIQREWANYGWYESGDVVLSIPSNSPLYAIGEIDRLIMLNSSEPFSITMTMGVDDVFKFPVVSVDRVFWKSDNNTLVNGSIPTVNSAGVISWGAVAPEPGTQFSATGRKRPEFFCFKEFPQDRAHHAGLDLPRRVVLRRFDLFGKFGNTN